MNPRRLPDPVFGPRTLFEDLRCLGEGGVNQLGIPMSSLPLHGAAAEGAAVLKRGVEALKYGRAGKPHGVTITLSQDETSLGWERRGLGKFMRKSESRRVHVTELLEGWLATRPLHFSGMLPPSARLTCIAACHSCFSQCFQHHPRAMAMMMASRAPRAVGLGARA